jgi:hypothetical protein
MKETTLTLEQIETLITGYQDSPFYIRSNIVIPNCNWGFLNHEADLLVLSKAATLPHQRGTSDEGVPLSFEHELNELTRIYKEL